MTEYVLSVGKKLNLVEDVCPHEYRYNNGWFNLFNKVPDIVNINGEKKLVELYGTYWHRNDNPQDRIQLFKKAGYDTLIIWEHNLEDIQGVRDRVEEFTYETKRR